MPRFGSCSHGRNVDNLKMRTIKIARMLKDRMTDQEEGSVALFILEKKKLKGDLTNGL